MSLLQSAVSTRYVAGCLALAVTAPCALAVENLWTGATSNSWNEPTNWSLNRVPSAANGQPTGDTFDDANVSSLTNFPVLTGNPVVSPRDLIIAKGGGANGRLDQRAGIFPFTGGWLFVGDAGGTGEWNIADTAAAGTGITGFGQGSASVTGAGRLYVGRGAGSDGTFRLNTSGSVTIGDQLQVGIGGGTGTLLIESGAINSQNWTEVGNGTGSMGTLQMTGGSLNKTGNDGISIGTNGGVGVATIDGGAMTSNNGIRVGVNANSDGTLHLNGGSTVSGGNTVVGLDGGTGELNVTDGLVDVGNETWLGQAANSVGVLNLGGGEILSSSWVAIGRDSGTGTVNMTGGTWTQEDNGDASFIVGASGPGTFNHSGGDVNLLATRMWIGENGGATYNLSGTGAITAPEGVQVARGASSTSTLNLQGGTLNTNWINGGAGNSTVNFDGTQINLTASDASFLTGFDTATIGGNDLLVNTVGFSSTGDQILGGSGGIVKSGEGSLALLGAHTYAGTTTVQEGMLTLSTDSTNTNDVVVEDGGSLGVTEGVLGSQLSPANLSFGGPSTLNVNFTDLGGVIQTVPPIDVTGTLTRTGDIVVNVNDVESEVGTLPLLSYASSSGTGSFQLGSLPEFVSATLNDNGSLVSLDVTSTAPLVWNGLDDGNWNFTSTDWDDQATNTNDVMFENGRWVLFDFGTEDVNLTTTVEPFGTVFDNPDGFPFTVSGTGAIAGDGVLTKRGDGSTTITTSNTFTGSTLLEAGTLSVPALADGGVASPIGASSADPSNLVFSGGTLYYTGPATTIDRGFLTTGPGGGIGTDNALTLTGPATSNGEGNFVKSGPGNLILTHDGTNVFGDAGLAGVSVLNGTLTLDGTGGTQNNDITGELRVGSDPGVSAHAVFENTSVAVSAYLTVGRGNGTGATSTLTATDSTITTGAFSSGYNADLPENDSDQVINLIDTNWTSNGRILLGESVDSNSVLTLTGTSTVNKPGEYFSIGVNGTATLNLQDDSAFTAAGDFNVSDVGTSTGTLNIEDNATLTSTGVFFVGKNTGTTGNLNISGGTIDAGLATFASGAGSTANVVQTAGVVNMGNDERIWFGNGGTATWDQSGGETNVTGFQAIGRNAGSNAIWTVSGGTLNQLSAGSSMIIGESGSGTLTVSGTGVVDSQGYQIEMATRDGGTGALNLNSGGTLRALQIQDISTGVSTINFDGGTLVANAGANLAFIDGIDTTNVMDGGVTIDTNSQTVGIGVAMLDGDGLGGGLTKTGDGFLQLNGANLYTGTTTVSAGSVGGTGSVAGPLVVEATGTLAPGTSAGTFTAGDTTISGSYAYEIDGAAGDTLVVNGNLSLTGATLAITELNPGTAGSYVVAQYSGSLTGTFAVTGLPGGWSIDYGTGTNSQITLINPGGGDPFTDWIAGFFPGETDPAIVGAGADPDADGQSNLVEFALGGSPDDGGDNAKVHVIKEDSDADGDTTDELLMTIAVRSGTPAFAGSPSPSATQEGVVYTVEGSLDLATFGETVDPAGAVTTDLPTAPDGYEYRTFSLNGSNGLPDRGFLRVEVTED